MHRTVMVVAALGILALAGCASKKPIIDNQNVDMAQYERDLADCQQIAQQVDTGGTAVKSAAGGAAVGAALGAVWGDVGRSATSGAITGGAGGLLAADSEEARVIKNCLRNRGYRVLN